MATLTLELGYVCKMPKRNTSASTEDAPEVFREVQGSTSVSGRKVSPPRTETRGSNRHRGIYGPWYNDAHCGPR